MKTATPACPLLYTFLQGLLRALLSLPAIFALSIPLFLTACGGSAGSTPGAAKPWTWMSGSNTVGANGGQPGVYGTLGSPAVGNFPGGRAGSVSWRDGSGNLWLFGGFGPDSTGAGGLLAQGLLNDLWVFNPTSKEWTWMSGSNTLGANSGQSGVYGTLGTPAASNVPGGRGESVGWMDGSGNLWLFGGYGPDSTTAQGDLNDLWRYQP